MRHRLLQRFSRVLRLPALAVLLLAVLVNPVFASLGDLHELGSGSDHLHAVSDHEATGSGHDHADGDAGEGDLLHALMHASHCCGHLTAIVPAPLLLQGVLLPSVALAADAVPLPTARPASLLRPPIVA
ncbi:hypothetical protein [Pseudoxanthomonas sp. PXM02]|uniref:hypothetical protein n=1 Tax=Pseudoxanthomonas sp. PXM02 TaxID=2769294 RepID=UPI00177E9D6D|nr:hypothetical protein [Pseudoxanthomonas sp. PXM02]MBD9481098.1 hypothetical protein [Pseudoxanthomonas sp. PXM02]